MFEDDPGREVERLREDNARLRRLLERQGAPTGLRHQVRNTLATVREFVRRSSAGLTAPTHGASGRRTAQRRPSGAKCRSVSAPSW